MWQSDGDMNMKYFHNCVKKRKVKNRIHMLINENGFEQFSKGSKGNIATYYFRNIFERSNPSDLESLFEGFSPKATRDIKLVLTAHVSDMEVKLAAFIIKCSSGLGADGLTGNFYQ